MTLWIPTMSVSLCGSRRPCIYGPRSAKSKPSLANRGLIHPESTSSSLCEPRARLTEGIGIGCQGQWELFWGLLSRHHHGIGSVKRFVCRANPRCRNKNLRVPRSAVILAPGESGSRQLLGKMRWEVMQRRASAPRPHRKYLRETI